MSTSELDHLPTETLDFTPLKVIERDLAGLEFFIVPVDGEVIDDIASGLIDRADRPPDQMRAWARLFAAAPDLLAALKAMMKYYDTPSAPWALLDPARAAIARAEGRP